MERVHVTPPGAAWTPACFGAEAGKGDGTGMGFAELLLLAVGLSMDAFAVSVCKGLATGKVRLRHMLCVGIWFGGFQALMPFLGWLLGVQFQSFITSIDHWIAFVLLGLIGVNMIRYFGPVRNIQKHPDSNTRLSPGCCLYSNNGFIRWPLY